MKKIMYSAMVASMLSGSALAAESELKCYENKDFMKMIDDKNLSTIYNGLKDNNRVSEIMMSKERYIYVVEYDKATDGNAFAAKQYCVTTILKNVTFNESAVEYLYQLLEKVRGQKT